MEKTGSGNGSESWRRFLRRHRNMFLLLIVGAILAFVGAILVFLWFVGQAQSTGMVPATLGLWTVGYIVTFLLNLIFWEILLIAIPVIVAAIIAWLWWKRLPYEERAEYRFFRTRSRARNGGNAFTFLVNIAFLIKIYLDGNWHLPFNDWTFNYLVYSYVTALVWILIIFGIPIAIGLIWWISRRRW